MVAGVGLEPHDLRVIRPKKPPQPFPKRNFPKPPLPTPLCPTATVNRFPNLKKPQTATTARVWRAEPRPVFRKDITFPRFSA
mgnify:CR=1 FL=1